MLPGRAGSENDATFSLWGQGPGSFHGTSATWGVKRSENECDQRQKRRKERQKTLRWSAAYRSIGSWRECMEMIEHSSFSDRLLCSAWANPLVWCFPLMQLGPTHSCKKYRNNNHRMLECNYHMMHHSSCALQSSYEFTRPGFQSRWHNLQKSKGCLYPYKRHLWVCVIYSETI